MFYVIVLVSFLAAIQAAYIPLSKDQVNRLSNWTRERDGNMWEISGQFEGDIILTKQQEARFREQRSPNKKHQSRSGKKNRKGHSGKENRNGAPQQEWRWPDRTLVYAFEDNVAEDVRQQIQDALKDYERTCVRIRYREGDEQAYVKVSTNEGKGCFSTIGYHNQVQDLNLENPGCIHRGTIIHEFLHAFGFWHMHSDPTRDDFIRILWENVLDGEQNTQLQKYDDLDSFGYTYDYGSVMHYSEKAYSINDQITIETINPPNSVIGQADGLSDTDIGKLNAMYGC